MEKIIKPTKYYVIQTDKSISVVSEKKKAEFLEKIEGEAWDILECGGKQKALMIANKLKVNTHAEKNYALLKKSGKTCKQVFGKKECEVFTVLTKGNFVGVIRGFHVDRRLTEGISNSRMRFFSNFYDAFEWFKVNIEKEVLEKEVKTISFYNNIAIGYVFNEEYIDELFGNYKIIKSKHVNQFEAKDFVMRSKRYFEGELLTEPRLNVKKSSEVIKLNIERITTVEKVVMFTDGAFLKESGGVSYGISVFVNGKQKINIGGLIDKELYKTSTGSELWAVLKSMELAIMNDWREIEIHYDCNAVQEFSEVNLKNNSSPTELQCNFYYHFNRLKELGNLRVILFKVKGHSDSVGNKIADEVAVRSRKELIYY